MPCGTARIKWVKDTVCFVESSFLIVVFSHLCFPKQRKHRFVGATTFYFFNALILTKFYVTRTKGGSLATWFRCLSERHAA